MNLTPLLSLVALPVLGTFYAFYRWGKRHEELGLLYSFAGASLLAKFMFRIDSGIAMIGFFIMLCLQRYDGPSVAAKIDFSLDRERMELTEYYLAENLESESVASDKMSLVDEMAELGKRRRVCVLMFVVLTFMASLDGMNLPVQPTWQTMILATLERLLEAGVLCVALLHGYVHATNPRQLPWFLMAALWWTVASVLTLVPVMVGFSAAYGIVLYVLYAVCGGFLFWLALYFVWVDCRQEIAKLATFGLTAVTWWLVMFFQ